MNCTKCNTENLDSAKFCKKCGHDLSQKETKQVKRKRSVKISGGKIKFAIVAVVIIGLIGAGAMSLKKKSDEKRILSVEYLEDLDKRGEEECNIDELMGGNMDKKEIDFAFDKCMEILEETVEVTEIFVAYAKETKLSDNAMVEDFMEKYEIIRSDESTDECYKTVLEIKANKKEFRKIGFNEDQTERLIFFLNGVCHQSKLLDEIEIEKKTEQIEAVYTEQENDKIPAGYSIITAEPQNGEKENVTIIVDGEEKGSGEIVTKEPQNGVKMVGSGNTEDIAKQGEEKLNQILKLWREQNFTAKNILPFLTEETQNKAPDWENAYKKLGLFNWRRFDKVEPMLGLASFKENKNTSLFYYGVKNEAYPFVMYLPVTVSYYLKDSAPEIPFYYSVEKDEWVSGNGTFTELFEIIKYQNIGDLTKVKDIPKNDKPKVELFVMSHCPYGIQIEKGILPVLKTLGDKIDFELKFCNYAMHGEKELKEQMRQYCIQKEEPDKLESFLSCFLEADESDKCVAEVGINSSKLASCVATTDKEHKIMESFNDEDTWISGKFPIFDVYKEDNVKYGVSGSPTLVINEVTAGSISRDSKNLLATICSAFETLPRECDTELSSDKPAPGFGSTTN